MLALLPLAVGLVTWVISLQQFEIEKIDDMGLVSATPATFWAAAGIVIIGFALLLGRAEPPLIPGLMYLGGLVLILHATPGFIEPHPRFPTAWTHVGFVDQVIETGRVDPGYDARYNWPGAFSLGAFLTELGGEESSRALLRWAPAVMNLLFLAPLLVIAQQVSRDRTIQLAALCVAVLGCWVGQDYLAPQAVAFLLHLTVVGILLRYFRDHSEDRAVPWYSVIDRLGSRFPGLVRDEALRLREQPARPTTTQQVGLYLMLLLVGGVLSFSHQLTPFLLVATVAVLVVFGRVTVQFLPLTLLVVAVAWTAFGATSFLISNLEPMLESIGDLRGSIDANVADRSTGTSTRELVLSYRMRFTFAIGLLAGVGFARQWWDRRADWAVLALALTPAPLMVLNSYGGEVLLRVVLFMLPFLALLVPFAFFDEGTRSVVRRRAGTAVFAALCLVAVPLFMVTRYGNESFERIYSEDIAAWDWVAENVDPGTRVVVINFAGPWRYSDLTHADYRVFHDEVGDEPNPATVNSFVSEGGAGAVLLLGEGTARHAEVFAGAPADWQDDLADDLVAEHGFERAWRDGRAQVLVWHGDPG